MAGSTGTVWEGRDGEQSVLSVGGGRGVAEGIGYAPRASGRRGTHGLGIAHAGRECDTRAPAFSRGKKSEASREALGRSQGGVTTKIHGRVDGNGKPMTLLLTPGECHESTMAQALLEHGAVKRVKSGRPRKRPKRIVADKAYGSRAFRQFLRRRGKFDKAVYRERNQVERFFNRLKQSRRVATRYEKRAVNYLAMLTLAAILMWL